MIVPPARELGVRPFRFDERHDRLVVLDQRRLPAEEDWVELTSVEEVARSIETLQVRGAPAIACVAALGLVAAAARFDRDPMVFARQVSEAIARLAATRPTAVNLFVALGELERCLAEDSEASRAEPLRARLRAVALAHAARDLQNCLDMGGHGAGLMPAAGGVLTHCNAGALATAGYGTALGVIRRAVADGKAIHVFADETRPVLQGARLTAWELARDGIRVEIIADNMAGALMARGEIKAAIVGADRIVRNGDVANKIGTYSVAVLCRHHGIPFYVAAPWTTIDRSLADGSQIPIEHRDPDEVRYHGGRLMAPAGVGARNPAFDVTPATLVTAIITERGVHRPDEIADV